LAMESGEEDRVTEYVQMNSPPSMRRVKSFSIEEILEMSVEELRKILEERGQDTRVLQNPQLQKKLLT